jgi:hypothetical protein
VTDAPDTKDVPTATPAGGTDRPAPADAGAETIDGLVAEWRAELDGQVSVSASTVQDHLLDLWGRLPEGDARDQVERWLTETLQRNLYQVSDIDARLAGVLPSSDD